MKTITIQIGNSDDKLSQKEWAEFVHMVDMYATLGQVHFRGTSAGDAKWQNACWVIVFEYDDQLEHFKRMTRNLVKEYRQDSIAWTEGETEFLK